MLLYNANLIVVDFRLQKAKGVEGLIEIENPNRRVQKMQKAVNVDVEQAPTQISRRER